MRHIVTFKTLGSDAEEGSGFGTFILDLSGETVYVAATFHDSGLSPLEIMYVKSRDAFVPFYDGLGPRGGAFGAPELGTPAKLPDTVATDVDIRNWWSLRPPVATRTPLLATARTRSRWRKAGKPSAEGCSNVRGGS